MRSETTIAGPFDDQLATRLMHQRIVVLGQGVDDPIANRSCAELLLLSAEDVQPVAVGSHHLPGHRDR